MSQTGLPAFDTTIHVTNAWLKDVMEELGYTDRHKAYHAVREVLHALRDRLPTNEVAALGAQLPLLLRGVYYEGWHPGNKPIKWHREQFLEHLAQTMRNLVTTPEHAVQAVFQTLARHVSGGEIESVKHALPVDLRTLWPT